MNNVLIGVPSGSSIPISFWLSFSKAVKDVEYFFHNHRGTNTVTARNACVYKLLKDKANFTHLFFMDSDMVFPENTLKRLLAHEVDIVGGFYVRKRKGFLPNAFQLGKRPAGQYLTEHVNQFKEVEGIGTGCLLVKKDVFKKIEYPWFEYKLSKGSKDGHMKTEDLVFCDKAKEQGFKIYCDGTIKCGHINQFIIWPTDEPGKNRVEPV